MDAIEATAIRGDASMETYTEHALHSATNISPTPYPFSLIIPPSLDAGQALYWSHAWLQGEQETRKALAEGQGRTFPNAEEAIRWLLSDDAKTEP